MIVVIGYLTIDPAKRDEVHEAIGALVPATRAEDGCIDYRYSIDIDDPARINIVEQWESEDAMNAHMGTEHLATFMGVMGTCLGGPVEIVRHDVASSTKLF